MTSELWNTPPQFAQGQYFSAAMHGNALINNCEVLLGVYNGPSCLWQTGKMASGSYNWNQGYGPTADGYRIWSGAVRHKTSGETLTYCVRVWRDSVETTTVKVKIIGTTNTHNIAAGSGYVDQTGSIDISGKTADTFYEVFVDVACDRQPTAQVLYIFETDAQSYAALAGFTAGSTPTAAQWAALSARASTLWQQQTEPPLALFGSYHTHQTPTRGEAGVGRWLMRYNNAYLAYQFRVRYPANRDMSYHAVISVNGVEKVRKGYYCLSYGVDETETTIALKAASVGLSGGEVMRLQNGSELFQLGTYNGSTGKWDDCVRGYNGTTPQALSGPCYVWQPETDGETWERQADYVLYRGVVDISQQGLVEGSLYEVTATEAAYDAEWDLPSNKVDLSGFGIDYIYTVSASTPTLTGWSAMPSFHRGSTVGGAGSMKTIRDNLTWLSATTRIVYRNNAAPYLGRWGGYGVRQKRWLVYYCTDAEQQPELVYWRNTKEVEVVGLTNRPYEWVSYDLDGAEGLWDGVGYHVRGVTYAMEDDSSV